MAGELCTENNSTASASSSIHNFWQDQLHACSWSTSSNSPWQGHELNNNYNTNNNSESSGEENVSISTTAFTNGASNRSSDLSTENEFVGETVASDNHLWNHLLLSVGCQGELHNQDVGENLVDTKNVSADGMFNHPLSSSYNNNYSSKKIEDNSSSSWGFPNFNNATLKMPFTNLLEENSAHDETQMIRPQDCNDFQQYSIIKDPLLGRNFGHHDHGNYNWTTFGRSISDQSNNNNRMDEYQRDFIGDSDIRMMRRYSNMPLLLEDSTSFTQLMGMRTPMTNYTLKRPLLDINLSQTSLKTLQLSSACRKHQAAFQTSPFPSPKSICNKPTKGSGRTQGSEGRNKRRCDHGSNSESVSNIKKPKQETSSAVSSSTKFQVPKVKLGDKITALQQIVSPFGKTDTASVLWEAIGYIRFLQEQIQLLSTPYMKGNASKELWGGLERKDNRGEGKLDLKSRGLCLVPISCTPQVYAETSISDYLTPVYRGCLYR